MGAFVNLATPLVVGYALDLLLGDPAWLPHPIVGFGRLIASGDRLLNRGGACARFLNGALLSGVLTAGVYFGMDLLQHLATQVHPALGIGFAAVAVFYALANRTLVAEGVAVFRAVDESLDAGRARLARIVGRDTKDLSASQVRTAACETMAENLNDGVVAPLCFYAVGGPPGMMAYKMVNTLDSMIGHRDERYAWFGKAAARMDDIANWIPARLTALLMVAVAASARGWRFVRRYGRAHLSPNAGYPEAALAGILDVRFGGPHMYGGELIRKPWIGENAREIAPTEIIRVAKINHAVCLLVIAIVVVVSALR